MNLKLTKFFLVLVLLGKSAVTSAFIPPLTNLIHDSFEGRKPGAPTETVVRHQIETQPGQSTEVEEHILVDRGRTYYFWKSGASTPVFSVLDKRVYSLPNGKKFLSRSALFWKYVAGSSSDDFREELVAERFIRRDQLLEYKADFNPTGDPSTWGLKDNLVVHPDIFLTRLKNNVSSGVVIGVLGSQEPESTRTVFFDRALTGVRRWEWKEGNETTAWNFDQFVQMPGTGIFPHHFSFEHGGNEIVTSDFISHHALKDKQALDLVKIWQRTGSSPISPGLEEALKTLLSYR